MIEHGLVSFLAGTDLDRYRRVKFQAGTATSPPPVVYAGEGEMHVGLTDYPAAAGEAVAVRLLNHPGTHKAVAAGEVARGAVLYAAAEGKVSGQAVGSALGVAKNPAGKDGVWVELVPFHVLSTTAATVSLADAAAHFDGNTVEAALAQLGGHLTAAGWVIPAPLAAFTREDGTPLAKFADGSSTIPGFSQEAHGVMLRWNNHATPQRVAFQLPLPGFLDDTADIEVRFLAALTGATDTPALSVSAHVDGGPDAAPAGPEISGTELAEYVVTIPAASVPAGARILSVALGPTAGELGADDLVLSAPWLEIKPKLAAS
ncbi:MAG: hypothetical protein KQJ78_14745 [Deltaproteobacteria bacterium]|nr:hypothetical protein [Deltaproteobacteria bacterium]